MGVKGRAVGCIAWLNLATLFYCPFDMMEINTHLSLYHNDVPPSRQLRSTHPALDRAAAFRWEAQTRSTSSNNFSWSCPQLVELSVALSA